MAFGLGAGVVLMALRADERHDDCDGGEGSHAKTDLHAHPFASPVPGHAGANDREIKHETRVASAWRVSLVVLRRTVAQQPIALT